MKRLYFIMIVLMLLAISSYADSISGWAGGAADNATTGTATWTNPTNAVGITNGTYATVSVDGTSSHYLYLTNYSFAIPTNATINGIVVTVDVKASSLSNGGSRDNAVRLITNSVIGAVDRAITNLYTTTDALYDHGSSTDTWGVVLSPAIINSPRFGTAFSTTKPNALGPAHTISVDGVLITIHYTQAGVRRKAIGQFIR